VSDTPRTDAETWRSGKYTIQTARGDTHTTVYGVVSAEFARTLERELAAVTAALLDMTADRDSWRQQCSDRADDAAKAIRERDAAMADARRYRWLRDDCRMSVLEVFGALSPHLTHGLDAAIDAAMAGKGEA
jgi:hypothetical protein